MKKIWILLLLPTLAFSQKREAVFKKLADYTCNCSQKNIPITETAVGICIFEALGAITDKEKKIIGYNPDKKADLVEKIAENIGMEMALICPQIFSKMEKLSSEEEVTADTDEVITDVFFTGTVESIASNEFKTIFMIDDKNEKKEFIWLFSFEGDSLFIKNKIGKGDKLEIHYREQEFFNPKSNSYRLYNEITAVKFL